MNPRSLIERAAQRITATWSLTLSRTPQQAAQIVLDELIADRAAYVAMAYPETYLCALEDAVRHLQERIRYMTEQTALWFLGQATHGLSPANNWSWK